jgi:hypothetical protein
VEPVWRSDGSQPYAQRVTSVTAADTTGTYSANVGTALCSRGDRSPSRSHQSATDWPTPSARMIAVKAVRPYPAFRARVANSQASEQGLSAAERAAFKAIVAKGSHSTSDHEENYECPICESQGWLICHREYDYVKAVQIPTNMKANMNLFTQSQRIPVRI